MDKIIIIVTGTYDSFDVGKEVIVKKDDKIIVHEDVMKTDNAMYLANVLETSFKNLGFEVELIVDIYDPVRTAFEELLGKPSLQRQYVRNNK